MKTSRGLALVAVAIAATVLPVEAHHAMDGELPSGPVEGLLSGLAHPVIGIDHALALVAVALLARTLSLPLAFVAGSALGVALPAAGLVGFANETAVVLSVAALGVWLGLGAAREGALALVVTAAIGMLHGFAYAGAIVGAETTPLLAYGFGLVLVQSAIVVAIGLVARRVAAREAARRVWLEQLPGFAIAASACILLIGLGR
jgi:urease accessory protein